VIPSRAVVALRAAAQKYHNHRFFLMADGGKAERHLLAHAEPLLRPLVFAFDGRTAQHGRGATLLAHIFVLLSVSLL